MSEMNVSTLSPKQTVDWLLGIFKLPDNKRMTAGIWGRAGEGKSDTVFQVAKLGGFEKVAALHVGFLLFAAVFRREGCVGS